MPTRTDTCRYRRYRRTIRHENCKRDAPNLHHTRHSRERVARTCRSMKSLEKRCCAQRSSRICWREWQRLPWRIAMTLFLARFAMQKKTWKNPSASTANKADKQNSVAGNWKRSASAVGQAITTATAINSCLGTSPRRSRRLIIRCHNLGRQKGVCPCQGVGEKPLPMSCDTAFFVFGTYPIPKYLHTKVSTDTIVQ